MEVSCDVETHFFATDGLRMSSSLFCTSPAFHIGRVARSDDKFLCLVKRAKPTPYVSLVGKSQLHVPGLDGLDMPIVWVFLRVTICLSCGVAEFHIPERELQIFQDNQES